MNRATRSHSRKHSRHHSFSPGARAVLLAAALIIALGACGKHHGIPGPGTPPHPTTLSLMRGHVVTADLRLHVLPHKAASGWM